VDKKQFSHTHLQYLSVNLQWISAVSES